MKKISFFLLIMTIFAVHTTTTIPSTPKHNNEKIKLYICYTPSHRVLREQFLTSMKDDYEIVERFFDQDCQTAQFLDDGWKQTTLQKVDMIIDAIKENWGKIFIYSDVDIQFFQPTQEIILDLIKDKDMVIQKNRPNGNVCSGFFACRGNEKILTLWNNVKRCMLEKKLYSDQRSLSLVLKESSHDIRWSLLPVEFFGGGTLTGILWSPGQSLPVPKNIILHHANWTVGVPNKIAQLQYVRDIVHKNNMQ